MKKILIRKTATVLIIISFLTLLTFQLTRPTFAQNTPDFEINTTYDISYDPPSDYVQITEEIHLEVNNQQYYFPAKEKREFILPDFDLRKSPEEREFKIESIQILDENRNPVTYTVEEDDDGIKVFINNNKDITYWNDEKFTIVYNTHELINQNGNVTNLYIPGLPDDTTFQTADNEYGLNTRYNFFTSLTVPEDTPKESYSYPQGKLKTSERNKRRVYSIAQQDRLGETAWIQLGTKQYYYFKVVQPTPKTDNFIPEEISKYSDLISTNIYEIPLPKDYSEVDQKVFFSRIDPQPTRIELDDEGNYMATFEVPANKDGEIIIEGYITLDSDTSTQVLADMNMVEYDTRIISDPSLAKYTQPDTYWESSNPVVSDIASQLAGQSDTLLGQVETTYNYVIDTFDYSYEKVNGDNQRLGALASLQGGQAVCMEYSDTAIALLRAQGIPARAAIGYGNDPTGAENEIGDEEALAQNIGHQWLQVWVPEYGWLSVDPTWGESGRKYIGANLDHILWYTVGTSTQGYVGTSLSTADPVSKYVLTSYDVFLRALSEQEFDENGNYQTLSDLTSQYEGTEPDEVSVFLKTTSVGKIVVIVAPILVLLFVLFMITSVFSAIIKVFKDDDKLKKEKQKTYYDRVQPPTPLNG